jgi:hypothetical protein
MPWICGAYKSKKAAPVVPIVNNYISPTAAPAARTPEEKERAARAYLQGRQTKDLNANNKEKVKRYEEFFLRLLYYVPGTPVTTAWQDLPPQILDSAPIRKRMRALSEAGTSMPLLAIKDE